MLDNATRNSLLGQFLHNNFSGLPEEERWLAQTYLPLVVNETHPEALSQIEIAVKTYGVKGF